MRYREKLSCPASWWVIALAIALTSATAIGFYLGPPVALAGGIVTAVAVAAILMWFGALMITVDERGLTVGKSTLEWEYQGSVRALDADAARARMGPDADARAHEVTRPFVGGAVEVEVRDAADPHPYWLVSTRQPAQLAAAIVGGQRVHGRREAVSE